MDKITKLAYESLNNYFLTLSQLGYLKDSTTSKLFLLLFIEEFLSNYESYITEEDCNKINSILTCITDGTCLVPYIGSQLSVEPIKYYLLNIPIKSTEDNEVRVTESAVRLQIQ